MSFAAIALFCLFGAGFLLVIGALLWRVETGAKAKPGRETTAFWFVGGAGNDRGADGCGGSAGCDGGGAG